MDHPSSANDETLAALISLRDKCAADLHRLQQQLKGVEQKIQLTEVKLETLMEAVQAATKASNRVTASEPKAKELTAEEL